MEKFEFGQYDPSKEASVFTETNNYSETKSEEDTRQQFSFPLNELKEYINEELGAGVDNLENNVNTLNNFKNNTVPNTYATKAELSTGLNGKQPVGNYATKEELNTKQNGLTAGANITIVNDVISATGEIGIDWLNVGNKPLINGKDLERGNNTLGNLGIQPTLVSGVNIKTINETSLLEGGNLTLGNVGSSEIDTIKILTPEEYDALPSPRPENVLYFKITRG